MDEFEARAGAYISQHQMLQKGDTVIVALSGGADSMALFHFLFSVQNVWGLRLRAAHVNHGLRGAAADGDAAFVRAQCAARGVPLDETLLSPPENAGEEWGRQERYAFFARLAQAHGAKVATAHTCSDNAETVLLNLIRGTGLTGLSGIAPVRGIFVRPLLDTPRQEIEDYLAGRGIPHVEDRTNTDPAHTRNRIRHEVLPLLRQLNPRVEEALVQTAGVLRQEDTYLHTAAERVCRQVEWRGESAALERKALLELPAALQGRVVRSMLDLLQISKKDKFLLSV